MVGRSKGLLYKWIICLLVILAGLHFGHVFDSRLIWYSSYEHNVALPDTGTTSTDRKGDNQVDNRETSHIISLFDLNAEQNYDVGKEVQRKVQKDIVGASHYDTPLYMETTKMYETISMANLASKSGNATNAEESPRFWSKEASRNFLQATTSEIYNLSTVEFLKGLKNPCFAVQNGSIVEGISASYALQHNMDIKCFPYFFLAGFTKCGTSEFYGMLKMHPQVLGGFYYPPGYTKESSFVPYRMKEHHWWDNFLYRGDETVASYTQSYTNSTHYLLESFNTSYKNAGYKLANIDLKEQIVLGDFTPNTIWDAPAWHLEKENHHSEEPLILIPHKIKKFLPNVKIIILLRNPTDRLQSNYHFRNWVYRNRSQEDFHRKVVASIEWWKKCQEMFSEKRCAYGHYYPPELGYMDLGDIVHPLEVNINPPEHRPDSQTHSHVRLRVGLYSIYIKLWLEIFPKERILFLNSDDFSTDPLKLFTERVIPFLDLPLLTPETRMWQVLEKISSSKSTPHRSGYEDMWPETREMLNDFYRPYIDELVRVTGDNSFRWY